jgi:hypothetical protein
MVKHPVTLGAVALFAALAVALGRSPVPVLVAAVVVYLILRIGVVLLGGMARPVPEPLPAGELRKVRLLYRCSICGTEVRMTAANNEDPDPPRHCLEDMDMIAPTME